MNLFSKTFIALAAATVFTLSAASASAPPVRILPLGDSITSGESGSTVVGAYRNRLHTLLTGAGYNVDFVGTFSDAVNPGLPDRDHQGLGGARIDQIQANLPGWLNAIEHPDVVLLCIGTNDFWQNYQLATVQNRLTSLIGEIATLRPYAKIIVATLPLRTDNASINSQQVSFSNAIPGIVAQQVALGRQVSMVDMYPLLGPADINGDGVHPNQSGSDKMGEAWFSAIAGVTSPEGNSNPPVIARINPLPNPTSVPVVFSKPVADASANVANFSIPGVTITAATLDAATKRTITLTTSALTPGISYTVSVSGVHDRTLLQKEIAPGSMAAFSLEPLINGSFENDFAGWNFSGNVEIKVGPSYVPTDGLKLVAFNANQANPNGILSQAFATTVGQTYQLSFDVGAYGFNTDEQRCQVMVSGATTLVSDTIAVRAPGSGLTRWIARNYTFTANSATTTLAFTDLSTTSTNLDLVLDNVKVGVGAFRSLAVTTTPVAGAAISISPTDLTGSGNGTSGLLRQFANGASVTVTAPATLGSDSFVRWQRNGVDLPGSLPATSVTMNSNITLNAVYGSNLPPVAANDAYSTPANTALVVPAGGVLTNDFDEDGNTMSAVLSAPPLNGSLVLSANGGFTYTPAAGFTGTDSFTYTASDGVSNSNVATVTISVVQNQAQLVVNGSFEADFTGWTAAGNVVVRDASPYVPTNGVKLAAFNTGQTTPNGTLTQSMATIPGQTYQLAFDMGALAYNTNQQRLEVKLDGSTNLLTEIHTVNGIGGGSTNWIAKTISFTANSATTTLRFRDASTTSNSIDLTLDNVRVIGSVPSHTLAVESMPGSGAPIAISPPDSNGSAGGTTTFTRTYVQGSIVNLSAPATYLGAAFQEWRRNGVVHATTRNTSVSIDTNVTMTAYYGENTPPVAANDSYATLINTQLVVPPPGVLANDTDAESNPLTAVLVSPPVQGTLALSSNGGFTYTPATGFTGVDSFTYRANDGSSNSATATVTLQVSGLTPGTIANGSFEQGETGWTMSGNRVVVDSAPPYTASHGTKLLVFNGGQSDPNGVISQTFDTIAGQAYQLELDMGIVGATTTTQRLQVTVAGAGTLVSVLETITGGGLSAAKWEAKAYTFIADSGSTTLTLEDKSTTTNSVDLLVDNVRLATGSARALTVASTLGTGVPVAVTPNDLAGLGNGITQFTRFFGEGDSVTLTAAATHGGNSFLKWTKDSADFATTPQITLTVGANDVTMTAVYSVNAPPVAVADLFSVDQETTLAVAAPGVLENDSDPDNDPLTAVLVSPPSNGTLTLNANGSFIYQPADGFSGTDSFTYRARDITGQDSNIVTAQITVVPYAPGTLVNGSFEDGETGWTITGNRVIAASSAPYTPTDGDFVMVLNGGNVTPDAVLNQTIATTPGRSYLLRLDMGVVGVAGNTQSLRVVISGDTTLVDQTETVTRGTDNPTWESRSFTFVANSAATTISLRDVSSSGNNRDLLLDNVRCEILIQRALTVNSSPVSGANVTLAPADLSSAAGGATPFTRTYSNGAVVSLEAPATHNGEDFVKWTLNGIDHDSSVATTVTLNGSYTMSAVYGSNNPPVAAADTYSTPADTLLTVAAPGVLGNDSDPENSPLTALLVNGPASGSLNLAPDGGFTYQPAAGFAGTDSFTYQANDGSLNSNTATVTINVQALAPDVLVNGSFENGEAGWTVTGNRSVVVSTAPYLPTDETRLMILNPGQVAANATLSQTFNTVSGTQYFLAFDVGVVGATSLEQRLGVSVQGATTLVSQTESLNGGGNNAVWTARSYTFTANSASTTLSFADISPTGTNIDLLLDNVRVHPVGTRTLVVDAAETGMEIGVNPPDRAGTGTGVTRMHRFFNDGAVVTLSAPVSYGGRAFLRWTRNGDDHATTATTSVTMNGDATMVALYSPPPNLLVNGSFEDDYAGWTVTGHHAIKADSPYSASDGQKLIAFNDAQRQPNGTVSQTFQTIVGATYDLTFDLGVFGFNTNNQRMQVTITGTGQLLSQSITLRAVSGSVVWTPRAFSFVANSPSTTLTFTDTSTTTNSIDLLLDNVRVIGLAPSRTLTVSSSPDTGVAISASPADADGRTSGTTAFTLSYDAGLPVTLTAPASSGSLPFSRWTRDGAVFSGQREITFAVEGDHELVAIYAANSPPLAGNDSYATAIDAPLTVAAPGVLANDSDADLDPLTAVLASGPGNGTLSLNPNGSFTYTPNAGFAGTDSFTYRASDGTDTSAVATVTIEVSNLVSGSIVNGSFEDEEYGWDASGYYVVVDSSAPYIATNGERLMVFNAGGTQPNAVISQTIATIPGETYAVDFDMGIVGPSNSQQRLRLTVTGNTTLVSQTETITATQNNVARWLPKSFSFVADSSSVTVSFADLSAVTTDVDLMLDHVRLVVGSERALVFNSTRQTPVAVTVSPADLDGLGNGNTTFTRRHNVGTVLSVSAPATLDGGTFLSWERNGTQFSTNATTTVTVNGNEFITAVYSGSGGGGTGTQVLTVQSSPAAGAPVTVSPADNNGQANGSASFTRTYNTGTIVTLTAAAAHNGANFQKWQRNGVDVSTNAATTVTMDAGYTMTAVYAASGGGALLVNGSFEQGFTGWTATGSTDSVRVRSGSFATDGSNYVDFNGSNSVPDGQITQTVATEPGGAYRVFFDMGVLAFNTNQQRLEFSATGNGALVTQTFSQTGNSSVNWVARSVNFTANSSSTTLSFRDRSTTTNSIDLLLDNIRLVRTDVPANITVAALSAIPVNVTVSPADNSGNANGTTQFTRTYTVGASVTLTAPGNASGGAFVKWRKNSSDFSTNAAITFTVDGDATYTAIYATPTGLIANGSFELGLTGWTASGSTDTVRVASGHPATDGVSLVEFNSSNSPNNGSITQTFATTAGTTYNLTFDLGVFAFNTNQQRLRVDVTGSGSLLSQTATINGINNGTVKWEPKAYSFVANSASTTLTLSDASTTTSAIDMLLDNVRVVANTDVPVQRLLNVTSTGITSVDVTITPADSVGNANGATPLSRAYSDGAQVTVTAPATVSGANFVKWQLGTSDLTTNTSATVTMSADRALNAVYNVPPPTPLSFSNGSFETGLSPWVAGGTPGAVNIKSTYPAPNGSNLVEFNASNTPNDGTLSQTFTTSAGATYNVIFDQGTFSFNTQNQVIRAEVLSDTGTVLFGQNYTLRGAGNGNINWATRQFYFTAASGVTTLRFRDVSTTTSGIDLLLDHVRMWLYTVPGSGPNLVTNGSFEQSYTGWSHSGSTRIEMPGPFYSTHGNNLLSYNVANDPTGGNVTQTITTVPGATYRIGYDVGVLGFVAAQQRLNLKVRNGTTNLVDQTTTIVGRADFVMIWEQVAHTFVAQGTSTTIIFTDTSTVTNAIDVFLDSVRVNSVPSGSSAIPPAPEAIALPPDDGGDGDESGLATTPVTPPAPPVLSGEPGAIRVGIQAATPGRYFLETSTDLATWHFHSERLATEPGPVEFIDESPPAARRFYRVGAVPLE